MSPRLPCTLRFCAAQLPSWTAAYDSLPKATPIFTIVCNGRQVSLPIQPGEEGRRAFEARIRELFSLGDEEICLTFGCRVPGSHDELTLHGQQCYDAACYLASLSAGQRKIQQQQKQQQQLLLLEAAPAAAEPAAVEGRAAAGQAVPAAQPEHVQTPPRLRGSPTSVLSAVRSLFS